MVSQVSHSFFAVYLLVLVGQTGPVLLRFGAGSGQAAMDGTLTAQPCI